MSSSSRTRKRRRKACERCGEKAAVLGERFCRKCRWWMLSKMWRDGYLTPYPKGSSAGVEADEAEFSAESGRLCGRGVRKWLGEC